MSSSDPSPIAKMNNVDIPWVTGVTVSKEPAGERVRTAGNVMRQDAPGPPKRIWTLTCGPMPRDDYEAMVGLLNSQDWAAVDFWLDEFGSTSNTVEAFVDPEGWDFERVSYGAQGGTWHDDGREGTMTIVEK